MYSSMVVYGLLTYDAMKNKISISNNELLEEFVVVLDYSEDTEIYGHLIKISGRVVEATWNKNAEKIGKLFNTIPWNTITTRKFYYNLMNLGFIVCFAYFNVHNTHRIEQKREDTREKAVDFIFYPEYKVNGTAMMVELRMGSFAQDALQ